MKKDSLTKPRQTRQPMKVEFELEGVVDHVYLRPINKFELAVLQEQIKQGFGVILGAEFNEAPPRSQLLAAAYLACFALCEENGTRWYDCGINEKPPEEMIEEAVKVAENFDSEVLVKLCEEFLTFNSEGIDSEEELEETRKNLQAIPSGAGN